MDTIEDRIERVLESAFAEAERARKEIDAAAAAGKEIIQVLCDPGTKRGDIIDITKDDPEEGEEEEPKKVKVVACHQISGMNPENFEVHHVNYAWCIVLKDSDITTEEDFAALYSDKEATDALFAATGEELGEAAVAQAEEEAEEPQDPNVCSCGARRDMCERNQNVFGGHLNE
jgi:hypothetical protein